MKTSMRVEGFDEVDDNLARLADMADADDLRALGEDALEPVAQAARGLVRQRSGRLLHSIGVGTTLSPAQAAMTRPDAGTVEIYVGPGSMAQAITEEFGTVFEPGHAFMRPAWDGKVSAVFARLSEGAGERLRKLTKS